MAGRVATMGRFMVPIGAILSLPAPAWAQVDQQRAAMYFREAAEPCERDGGRLWGVSLCGPMVFADARTQTIATSHPRPAEPPPKSVGFVNAPIRWGGTRWAAYIWDFLTPLPTAQLRQEFMIHELFHRIQGELGLMTETGHNEHLDTADGRVLLQLEWRALSKALLAPSNERIGAVRDALAFRLARRKIFPRAAENERRDEIREGLAQYTGTAVSASSESKAAARAVEQLVDSEKQESFVQTFAYTSGTAYGVLLDASSRDWRARMRATSDLGQMLMAALEIQPSEKTEAAEARYRGKELRAAEEERDAKRKALISELRRRFVDGPVLLLPTGGSGTFDIRGAAAVPGSGTVYFSSYRIKGEWGSLEATNGVLLSDDGTRRLPGPVHVDGANITGDGWRVTIAPGWVVRTGPRAGDYQLLRGDQ